MEEILKHNETQEAETRLLISVWEAEFWCITPQHDFNEGRWCNQNNG